MYILFNYTLIFNKSQGASPHLFRFFSKTVIDKARRFLYNKSKKGQAPAPRNKFKEYLI